MFGLQTQRPVIWLHTGFWEPKALQLHWDVQPFSRSNIDSKQESHLDPWTKFDLHLHWPVFSSHKVKFAETGSVADGSQSHLVHPSGSFLEKLKYPSLHLSHLTSSTWSLHLHFPVSYRQNIKNQKKITWNLALENNYYSVTWFVLIENPLQITVTFGTNKRWMFLYRIIICSAYFTTISACVICTSVTYTMIYNIRWNQIWLSFKPQV